MERTKKDCKNKHKIVTDVFLKKRKTKKDNLEELDAKKYLKKTNKQ